MIKNYIPILFFLLGAITLPSGALSAKTVWTEKEFGKLGNIAEKLARRDRWEEAIEVGEEMVQASLFLDNTKAERYVGSLTELLSYYNKAEKLSLVADLVKETYELSKIHRGIDHYSTQRNRTFFYKVLIAEQNYHAAIPLVLENVQLYSQNSQETFRLYHYYKQLYSLYGLTGQYEQEERAINKVIEMRFDLVGDNDPEQIYSLAQNLCRQDKFEAFKELALEHSLKYSCQ